MSKSLGNVLSPQDIIRKYGADILRIWVCMLDYLDDMRLSEEILARNAEAYRKIRNTCRFLLGNLNDFDPARHACAHDELPELDRWALHQTNDLIRRARAAYESYEFHRVYHALNQFCAVTMSALYLDILKDRLYTSAPESPLRRAAQTVLYRVLDALARLMAPVLSFTAEEVWQHLRHGQEPTALETSVHVEEFPSPYELRDEPDLLARWTRLVEVREEVLKALETAREAKGIGNSLEATITLETGGELSGLLERHQADLPGLFIVSNVALGQVGASGMASEKIPSLRIAVDRAPGKKCERCWLYTEDQGQDPAHPTVCGRCASVLREMETERLS